MLLLPFGLAAFGGQAPAVSRYIATPQDFVVCPLAPATNIADGRSHPLSVCFHDLDEARARYNKAATLTSELASAALQTAADSVPAGGGTITVPDGQYVLSPSENDGEQAIRFSANTTVAGAGMDKTISLVRPTGPYRTVFISAAANIEFHFFTVDHRVRENPIANAEELHPYRRATIYFNGSGTISVDAVHVENTSDLNSILVDAPLAVQLARITNNRFTNVGTNPNNISFDHSGVYVHCQVAIITGNYFEATSYDAPQASTAIESHAVSAEIANNVILKYQIGIIFTGIHKTASGINSVIASNTITTSRYGIVLWTAPFWHLHTTMGN